MATTAVSSALVATFANYSKRSPGVEHGGWMMATPGAPQQRQVMAQVAIYQLKFCLTTRMPRKRTELAAKNKKKRKEVTISSAAPFSDQLLSSSRYSSSSRSVQLRALSVSFAACLFPCQRTVPSANKWSAN